MGLRRISTPTDLGAAVREARTAAQLTQAELATRAGVSREWLIGFERGARPRAELTKILDVLSALDQPITLGHEEPPAPTRDVESTSHRAGTSTSEVTRKAIERTRIPAETAAGAPPHTTPTGASMQETTKLISAMPNSDITRRFARQLATMMPKTDLSSLLPSLDYYKLLPTMDVSALMPQPNQSLLKLVHGLGALQQGQSGKGLPEDGQNAPAVDQTERTNPEDDATPHASGADQ